MQSKELAIVAQLMTTLKSLEDSDLFYKGCEEDLKAEFMRATAKSTHLGEYFDSVRAQVADLRGRMAAKEAAVMSIVRD